MSEERATPGLGPVLLTVLLDLLGFGLVIPLLSFYAEDYGATGLQVTMLMAVYSIAQFVMAPFWGALSDRVGRRPVMLVSVGMTAVMLTAFGLANQLWLLFLFRTLHGAAAANISTAQAYVADVTTPENRARGMGLIGASFGVGFTLGPWMGGELSQFGYEAPIFLAAALSAVNFVWVLLRLPESHPPGAQADATHRRTLDPSALFAGIRHPVVGLCIALTFVAVFAFAMMEGTFALVAEHRWSMNAAQVGRVFGLIGIIGIVIQGGMIGRLTKRFGEPLLVGVGYALNGTGLAILAVSPGGASMWLSCTLLAFGSSLANPSLQSLISRAASAEDQGKVLGVNQSFSALARATAPQTGGLLYTYWFDGGAMAVGAIMMFTALLLSIPATRRAKNAMVA
ncbi:MAG: MFS transporter [Alphaproteobacteria bacterium]|nr:MFS transporter [Alphaproteobacteria bacterium]